MVFFFLFTLIHSVGCWFTLGGAVQFSGLLDSGDFLGQNGPPF